MVALQHILYMHSNKDVLFDNITFTVNNHEKIALIGNNGVGKSTLLKIISEELKAAEGLVKIDSDPFYIPQIFGKF